MKTWAVAGLAALASFLGASPLLAAPVHDFGCLASQGEDVRGSEGVHALGPFIEWSDAGDSRVVRAVRPFFVHESRPADRKEVLDVLWPVASFRSWDRDSDWRFLTVFGHDYDNEDPRSRYHVWALPLVFWGRNAAGEDYGALFPVGGKICEFLGKDEVSFVLFPAYLYTRVNDLETESWLWPLISRTKGKNIHGFRVAPFYGKVVREGEWEKSFIAWPVWTSVRYDRPGAQGYAHVLFPLYGHVKMENQESWMLIPPFIRWSSSARGREGYAPWPFVQFSSGRTDKLYLWPFWGRKEDEFRSSGFWLWPFIAHSLEKGPRNEISRFRVLPFVYSERERPAGSNTVAGATGRYFALWPLASYRRDSRGTSLRALCLWPVKDTRPIERNLAPIWTVFDRERTEKSVQTEVLWGLARWGRGTNEVVSGSVFPLLSWAHGEDRAADTTSWSVLKGLVGYEREGTAKRYRLLYFLTWGGRP